MTQRRYFVLWNGQALPPMNCLTLFVPSLDVWKSSTTRKKAITCPIAQGNTFLQSTALPPVLFWLVPYGIITDLITTIRKTQAIRCGLCSVACSGVAYNPAGLINLRAVTMP